MIKRTFITVFAALLVISCVTPEPRTERHEPVVDTPVYKATEPSNLPFWSTLTKFEMNTLMDLPRARAGDPDALLALGIMASGNVRDMKTFESYRSRIHQFVKKMKPVMEKEKTFWEKGLLLHQAVHREFYLGSKKNKTKGYALNQTRLTEIFRTKKYNCVSSALLFSIIARYFEIDVKGVLLPTHAFVQIESKTGKTIEIETTSLDGYDWVHDKKYYKKQAGFWFSSRGLRPSTHQDYLKRKIVPPYVLIATNMNNQHTSEKKMGEKDRFRLAEAHAFINPSDRTAQLNRLAGYNDIFNRLSQKKKHARLERMFNRTRTLVSDLRKQWKGDQEIQNLVSWVEYGYAHTLHRVGKHRKALTEQEAGLLKLSPKIRDRQMLTENHMSLIHNHMVSLTRQKKFEETERLFNKYYTYCDQVKWCRSRQGWFYQAWAIEYWNQGMWNKTVEKLDLQFKHTRDKKSRTKILANLDGAYYNWSITYQNQGDWKKAAKILENGLARYPELKQCRTTLKKLKAEHRM